MRHKVGDSIRGKTLPGLIKRKRLYCRTELHKVLFTWAVTFPSLCPKVRILPRRSCSIYGASGRMDWCTLVNNLMNKFNWFLTVCWNRSKPLKRDLFSEGALWCPVPAHYHEVHSGSDLFQHLFSTVRWWLWSSSVTFNHLNCRWVCVFSKHKL